MPAYFLKLIDPFRSFTQLVVVTTLSFGFFTLDYSSIAIAASGGGPGPIGKSVPTSYTLTIIATDGSVVLSPNQTNYIAGTAVTLMALPDKGYQFKDWSGDAIGRAKSITLIMDSNKTVAADFTLAKQTKVRSIREWVTGDGRTDDALGVAKAFAASSNDAFTLQVDCPVFMHVGMDIARPVFVDNGTHVHFTGKGIIITDNVLIPAFVMANTKDVDFKDWRVEYSGGLPINWDTGGYYNNGVWVPVTKAGSYAEPSFAFNDITLKNWLSKNRGIVFSRGTSSVWHGPTETSSMFYLIGDTSQVRVTNMLLFAASVMNTGYKSASKSIYGADKYIPMAFDFDMGYNSKQTTAVLGSSWPPAPGLSVPHDIQFSRVTLNGYYMGFGGVAQNISFDNILGLRYADLMDAKGENIGGLGKWFAPPHLFYIKYWDSNHPYDETLATRHLTISNVYDAGPRSGKARDFPGSLGSGYANSLKLGAVNSSVRNYISLRPDGLADILSCLNMTLTGLKGIYDSSFLYDLYPGVRFPANGYYQYLKLDNVTLTDLAENPYSTAKSYIIPFGYNNGPNNNDVTFNNVTVNLRQWTRSYSPKPTFSGKNNVIPVEIVIEGLKNRH